MIKIVGFAVLVCFLGATRGAAEEALEILAYPMERYQTILEKSPFAKETVVETQPAGPLFGQDLVLTGHFRIGETVYVLLLNRKTQERITVNSGETGGDRPKVVSLSVDANPANTTAVVQMGVQKATIRFDSQTQPKNSESQPQRETAENSNPPTTQSGSNAQKNNPDSGKHLLPRLRPIVPKAASSDQ